MTNQLTIHEAHRLLKSKQLSSVELTKASLERIHQVEPKVHALVTITDELALSQAQKADELIATGNINPLLMGKASGYCRPEAFGINT